MILITGGTGLSGSYVINELQRRNLPVRALARAESAPKLAALGVEVAVGDLTDLDSLRRACEGVTGIVHAAHLHRLGGGHRRHASPAGRLAGGWSLRLLQQPGCLWL